MNVTDLPLWPEHPWADKIHPDAEFRRGLAYGHEVCAIVRRDKSGAVTGHVDFAVTEPVESVIVALRNLGLSSLVKAPLDG